MSSSRAFNNFEPNPSDQEGPQNATLPCDEVAALIPAHSIGATDSDEAAAVNARLAACPASAAELARYQSLGAALLYAAPPVQAPARIEAQLRKLTEAQAARSGMPRMYSTRPTAPLRAQPAIPPRFTLQPIPPRAPAKRWSFGRIAATAAGLLLVGLNVGLYVQNRQLKEQVAQLVNQQVQQHKAIVLLATEQPNELVLSAVQENSQAQADVLWNSHLGVAVLSARSFPPLPPDKVYQLWLTKGDVRTSGGIFTVDQWGVGTLVFPITQSLDLYDLLGITPEPAGGSPGPTAPPVVRGKLQHG
ncbi:MAG: anti-sigma factor [Caldilineaceae bacterium]